MHLPKSITVKLNYFFPPQLEISACVTAPVSDNSDQLLEQFLDEVVCYDTPNSPIYLFPVFKERAKDSGLEFSVEYNTVLNPFRYMYAGLLWFSNYFVSKRGIKEYERRMEVKYDGF